MVMLFHILVIVLGTLTSTCVAECKNDREECEWNVWDPWGNCNTTCGGGMRRRWRPLCCKEELASDSEACLRDCNKLSKDRYDYGRCGNDCYNGGTSVKGSQSNHCECTATYYGKCCNNECPVIYRCIERHCTTEYNTECDKCMNNNIFFKRTHSNTKCERMCAWNNHYCWPGTCGSKLTDNCQCNSGFRRVSERGETSCQPSKKPSIMTCKTVFYGPNGHKGKKKQAESSTRSRECKYLQNVYGNFHPSSVEFNMVSTFTVHWSSNKPEFIQESKFGVTDTTVHIKRKAISGQYRILKSEKQLTDRSSSLNAKRISHSSGTIYTSAYVYNGQGLCVTYEAKGGGYLKSKDLSSLSHTISGPVPYQKTTETRELCYIFDDAPPVHCLAVWTCIYDPIQIEHKITRSEIILVKFRGWTDPIPHGGSAKHASGVESYQITVHLVDPSKGISIVTVLSNVFTTKLNGTTVTSLSLSLTSNITTPKLYCVTLEVKDVADNVKQARRFVLYDNTSYIETRTDKRFIVTSASTETNFTWQTHHNDICLDWNEYFYNRFYLDNTVLNPIEPDKHDLINGVYEQTRGQLPVSGTPNVHGIIQFMLAWSLNDGPLSNKMPVPNFLNQSFCQHFDVRDGATYILNIQPIDIANNTLAENRTVHIDRSAPHINNIWLRKDGYNRLYVHNDADLSKMKLYFEALDAHSGIMTVKWTFGISDSGTELAAEALAVRTIKETECPSNVKECYCPDVGVCEMFNYTIPLNKLIANEKHSGDHNRNYFFTVRVTNHAHLSNIEHVDILVDESPPEPGVVLEGPVDSIDIDYTSDESITVHWHGFIDHESGIKFYRIGMAVRCLGKEELNKYNATDDIVVFREALFTENSVRIPTNFTGKMFVTVIAFNNAMEPSNAVCSDGVTRDSTPPEFRNVTLEHGRWSESVVCHKGFPWLMHRSLAMVKLHPTTACINMCANSSSYSNRSLPYVLPTNDVQGKNENISTFMCQRLPVYSPGIIIYIPNDHIYITWDIEEDGSQIDDFQVGFGNDPSETDTPSIISYQSTDKKPEFRRRHEGIGSDTLFYIFIKAINKAGLEKITTLGPVLIDETPPLFRTIPSASFDEEHVVIGWEIDTFYDLEQTSQINQILFQIGHDDKTVTPLLEWNLDTSKPCRGYGGGCILYPLRKLQQQDTDLGLDFYVSLYVYNNAGHFVRLVTSTFRLPSRYPPGHAVVIDIDPVFFYNISFKSDADVHFTENTLCAQWSGFHHHESVVLEFGAGTSNVTDNVVPFYKINGTDKECKHSKDIITGIRYYILIRSSCSGGQTVSMSNGVTIWSEHALMSSLIVRVGQDCRKAHPVLDEEIPPSSKEFVYRSAAPLEVGLTYNVYLDGEGMHADTMLSSQNATVTEKHDVHSGSYFIIVPYIERPVLTFNFTVSQPNKTVDFKVVKCTSNSNFILPTNTLYAHWYYDSSLNPGVFYEGSLILYPNVTPDNDSSLVVNFEKAVSNTSLVLKNVNLMPEAEYQIALRPCTKLRCASSVMSEKFQIEYLPPTGTIETSDVMMLENKDSFDLYLQWNNFYSYSGIRFYQWTLSKDSKAAHLLLDWKTIDVGSSYLVHEYVSLPVHPHSSILSCVRAFSNAGHVSVVCKKVEIRPYGAFRKDVVYDFDATSDAWETMLTIIHSSNIGNIYTILHDAELDFGTTSTSVAGAIMYASEREVTWYLMTSQHIPDICTIDEQCIQTFVTYSGYVNFDPDLIQLDTLYFICAYSNTTIIERELFTETLDELSGCSNGFTIDNIPPSGSAVYVNNNTGYLTDLTEILISWDGFNDNVDARKQGYADVIKSYSYAIGSQNAGVDIVDFTNVGISTIAVERNAKMKDGSIVYVSVMATDHSGLSTTITSQPLIVDTSPPSVGVLEFGEGFINNLYTSSHIVSLHLSGFVDKESGIDHYEIGIGSHHDTMDILPPTPYYDQHAIVQLNENDLHDGHTYYIILKVVNRAGLDSKLSSVKFKIDKTAPTGGHVMDGNWQNQQDVDYQTDVSHIGGHWKGFMDAHSGIDYYRAGLGSRPYFDDEKSMVDVGLRTDIMWHASFIPGKKYYMTVDACNGAGLCSTMSSDGVIIDNSPPIHGLVRVGTKGNHQTYQPNNSSIRIHWVGFEDPHSAIDHFEACIGSTPEECDIIPYFTCLLQSNIIKTGLNLSSNTNYYATVNAFNKVGMNASQSSDTFRVDTTPPVVITKPTFLLDHTGMFGRAAQWDKSILRVFWKFQDNDSPIVRHVATLLTPHEGHTPIEHVELGYGDNITINLDGHNWLHGGDAYTVVVTCCNAAGLCTSEKSTELVIDSTPPHLGGFKPPMEWANLNDSSGSLKSTVTVRWYGFNDAESGVELFYFTASRSYSGSELTDGIVTIQNITVTLDGHETTVMLSEPIHPDNKLIFTLWARNTAGLNSSASRISVNALATSSIKHDLSKLKGILEIEKHSCDPHFCTGECTCAVLGKPCETDSSIIECHVFNESEAETTNFPTVVVHGGLPESPLAITASSACLSGHWWVLNQESNASISRFQWSMGILNQPVGEGIFDLSSESPWSDIGLNTEGVHCLALNRSLEHNQYYVVYVQAWYGPALSAIFSSQPVKIDQTPPVIKRGRFIKDADTSCSKDLDVIDWMDTITACWDDVFSEQQGEIIHYSVALGTSLAADDVYATTNVRLDTNITVSNITLTHGTRYYFTVSAYNSVGLHKSHSSDGFVIDMDVPVAGVVFNTERHRDASFQSANTSMSFSWHGFVDHFSGIKSYHVAIVEDGEINATVYTNVGLLSGFSFNDLSLEQNQTYYGVVKAYDNAGHVSSVARSRGKTVDISPPKGFKCKEYRETEIRTQMFNYMDDMRIHMSQDVTKNALYKVSGELVTRDIHVRNKLSIDRLQINLPLAIKHNGTRTFQYDFISPISGSHNISFAITSDSDVSITVHISQCIAFTEDDKLDIHVQQIGPYSIAVNAFIIDEESSVYQVEFGIGTTPGGFQVRPLTPVHGSSSGVLRAEVPHGSTIYVTAIAENYAGLRSVFHSIPVVMDHTAPILKQVYPVVHVAVKDVENDTANLEQNVTVETTWSSEDMESGVKYCFWGIGSRSGSFDIESERLSEQTHICISQELPLKHGNKIYVTVRCVNSVELATEVTSDVVTVVTESPNADHVELSVVPSNVDSYEHMSVSYAIVPPVSSPRHPVIIQSNTSCVHIKWTDFIDPSGIQVYEYRLLKHDRPIINWQNNGKRQMAAMNGLDLESGSVYTAEVRAINTGNYTSEAIQANVLVHDKEPVLAGSPLKISKEAGKLHLDWKDVFELNPSIPIVYSLTIGSRVGFSDILDISQMAAHTYDVIIDESTLVSANMPEMFVSIRCTYSTGQSSVYTTSY